MEAEGAKVGEGVANVAKAKQKPPSFEGHSFIPKEVDELADFEVDGAFGATIGGLKRKAKIACNFGDEASALMFNEREKNCHLSVPDSAIDFFTPSRLGEGGRIEPLVSFKRVPQTGIP